jgi:hypothetical protein
MKLNVMKLFRDLMKLGKVETDNGVLIYEGEVLEEGTEVFIEDENGNIVPAPDGTYSEYVVKDGKIAPAEVVEPEAKTESEEVKQEEEVVVEPEPEVKESDDDKYEERISALESKIAELEGKVAELISAKEELEFSQLKPAEKEIKDIATKESKGAMKYFEK